MQYISATDVDRIEFRALGSLAVLRNGEELPIGGPRQRRLLAMLLIHRNSIVSTDRLAEAVFAGEPTEAAHTTMRSYIARIRRVIDGAETSSTLITQAPGYGLRVTDSEFDIGRFEQLVTDGRSHLDRAEMALAAARYGDALRVWRGTPYAEFADEDWALPEAQRLHELRLVACERRIDAELASGHPADCIGQLEPLVAEHPLREGFRGQLMLALYRSGRQVDALRVYREYRREIAEELGLDPAPALAELECRILAHDPTLLLAEPIGEPLRGYRLGGRLGAGPNGVTYGAQLDGVHHAMTMTVLEDPRADEPDFVKTFDVNAQAIAALVHPRVIPVHDFWREPGAAYVVARRASGIALRELIDQRALDVAAVARVVDDVGGALVEASRRSIRHGWITADNIVVDDDGATSLTNFVVCPQGGDRDVADFAEVLRAAVEHCQPVVPATLRGDVDDVLTRSRSMSMPEFVVALGSLLSGTPEEASLVRPNPFKGLRPFDESDAPFFTGRSTVVDMLAERLMDSEGSRLTLLVGSSGSGKSSLVRAGLLPRIRSGQDGSWYVATMLPGGAPFKALTEAIRQVSIVEVDEIVVGAERMLDEIVESVIPVGGRLLLVIDQFEELFTLAPAAEQTSFLDAVATAVTVSDGRLHVVAALRADFYDRPLDAAAFGPLVTEATVALPPMTPMELESAIVEPVEAVGGHADAALVAELVTAVVDQPSALPALQFTLFELAEQRPDRCLTATDYHLLGGIDQAIATRAERLYKSSDAAERAVVRAVFEGLVVFGPESEPTSRRTPREDLAHGHDVHSVDDMLDGWIAARLLSGDHDPRSRVPTVRVAHEALLRSWPRLREWLEEDREAIVARVRLGDAAADWERVGRDDGALYRGAHLEHVVDIVGDEQDALPSRDREFLATSVAQQEAEQRRAGDELARQASANRRLRLQLGIIALALVAALVIGFVAVDQRRGAVRERDAADLARRNATARELAAAADANVVNDAERSILLALRAVEATRAVDGTVVPQAVDALHTAVTSSPVLASVEGVGGRLDWNPNDDTFVTEGAEESGMIDIRNATTGDSVLSFRGDDIDINDVEYSRDGTKLAVAGDDGRLKVFDTATGTLLAEAVGEGPVWFPSFDAAGATVIAQWTDESVIRLLDVSTGQSSPPLDAVANMLAMSPDGSTAAAVGNEPPYMSLFGPNAEPLVAFEGLDGAPYELHWSSDGTRIASVTGEVLRLHDTTTGGQIAMGAGHEALVTALDWSRDGSMIATGGSDGAVVVWHVDGEDLVEIDRFKLQDFAGGVAGLAFSPDGSKLAVGAADTTSTKILDLRPNAGGELATMLALHNGGATFGPAPGELLTVDPDGQLVVADASDGTAVRTLSDVPDLRAAPSLSPDGEIVAMALAEAGGFALLDADTGAPITEQRFDPGTIVYRFAWSGDGERLGLALDTNEFTDAAVRIVDRGGARLGEVELPGIYVTDLALDADGGVLALAQSLRSRSDPERNVVQLWDWAEQTVTRTLPIKAASVTFDPTYTRIAVAHENEGGASIIDLTSADDEMIVLDGATSPMGDIAFSPDGERIATAASDGVVRIWDAQTGRQLSRLHATGGVSSVDFSDDGRHLATADDSGVARVWTLDIDELVDIAETRVTRSLTVAECRQFELADCSTPS